MPFGEEIYAGVGGRTTLQKYSTFGADNIRKRFTGYEKDTETDLDFAQARMYQNKHGRFTTVDPLMASASLINPQTFNRYTYTGNNPINYTDPSGLKWVQDGNYEIYWIDDKEDLNGRVDVTGQTLTLGGGCDQIAGCVRDGAVVTFNEDRSITIQSDDEGNSIIDVSVEVINVTQEIIETTVSEISSTIGFSSAPTTDAPTIDLPTGGPGGGPLEPTGGSDAGSDPGGGEIDAGSSGDWQVDVAKLLWFAGQVWWNTSGGSEEDGEDEIELYRGVRSGGPDETEAWVWERFSNASQGMAIPRGGPATPKEHNEGNTNSIFTSWTANEGIAEKFASIHGYGGIVLTQKFPRSRLVTSPDRDRENEVLIGGPVTGASVKWIPPR